MAPRLWECPEHGRTGMIGFSVLYEQQTAFPKSDDMGPETPRAIEARDEFWFFCRGITAQKRVLNGGFYADEDYLWPDVQKELIRLFGKDCLRKTNPNTTGFKPGAFGVPDAPRDEPRVSAKKSRFSFGRQNG